MMRRPALLPLAWRLRARGFAPELFAYSTLWRDPEAAIERLGERLRGYGDRPVHLVAHSLGGLVALEALKRNPGLPMARCVCIGSPLAGSAAARGLLEQGWGRLSGKSGPLLRLGIGALPPGPEVGMIAGNRPMGLGRFFGRFDGPNDGTVALGETQVSGLAGHVVIHASHSGLIVSAEAAELAGRFLATGSFQTDAAIIARQHKVGGAWAG